MAVKITNEGHGVVTIVIDPAIDGAKSMLVYLPNLRMSIIEDSKLGDMLRVYFNDGERINLHYGVGVFVEGVQCTSNQDIMDKVKPFYLQNI